ncbi:hypothetical protein FDB55_09625 [Clostridium botulinum]|uniref:DUF7922 domain-containing protein n=1 Tax=Clostridium botulinum TaxID=1491 RepID=A0A0C2S5Q0_CLOBO|nr:MULTISPECIES: hypothetical protein [Clostridium]KAI3349611.1 hypothetical protein CIT18_07430 [Clostridium botulinum]KIL08437.1 hypothetical protein SR42_05360 [Clostridium botulinum]KOM89316.1 hypothetical protein ACP51_02700 [Clostridium botulinum]KOR58241.1 hypothetical protein ADT22_10715 [Clostridium botulinum]MBN1034037.1 hypothetical protein [Clostridium botulinum]
MVVAHNKLYRNFIILQQDEKINLESTEKALSGYAKVEAKGDKCKISFYAQNLKQEEDYSVVLICCKKDMKQLIDLGSLKINDVGKGDTSKEYYINNIAGLGISYEKINGAAICKANSGEVIFMMYGFINGEEPKENWKKLKVAKEDNTLEKTSINDNESKSSTKTELTEKKMKEKSDDNTKKENIKKENVSKSDNLNIDMDLDCDEDKNRNKNKKCEDKCEDKCKDKCDDTCDDKCEKKCEKKCKDKCDAGVEKEKEKEEHKKDCKKEKKNEEEKTKKDKYEISETEKCKKIIDELNDESYCTKTVNHKRIEENTRIDGADFEQYEKDIEKIKMESSNSFNIKGKIGEYFEKIAQGFEEYNEGVDGVNNCKWYNVPVNKIDDLFNISDYNKYTLVYYPMLNYYPYISKTKHFLLGYKCNSDGELTHIVYAIPGSKDLSEQPYEGKTGYVTWTHDDTRGSGYWLMFYDFQNSTVVVPMK